jgi:hypothetical protein
MIKDMVGGDFIILTNQYNKEILKMAINMVNSIIFTLVNKVIKGTFFNMNKKKNKINIVGKMKNFIKMERD